MTHRIVKIKTMENFVVSVVFQNGIEKEYDLKKLFDIFPQFNQLKEDMNLYKSVHIDIGGYGIFWNDELDLAADEIWDNGVSFGKTAEQDIKTYVGYKVTEARNEVKMTQKELAEKTSIYQADISNIERGISNPSVQTLQRLAEGMGMKLQIEFVRKDTF